MSHPRLIRGAAAERATRLITGERYEALTSAAEIRRAAQAEADQLLERVRVDCERARAEATAEGRERGLAAVTELLVSARAETARTRREAVRDLQSLAVKIAEKLIGHALTQEPALVVERTAEALKHAGEPKALRVRCHPEDLALLESGRPKLLERCQSVGALRFEADPQIARGGCILESELGIVDARLSVQLEAIDRALRGEST